MSVKRSARPAPRAAGLPPDLWPLTPATCHLTSATVLPALRQNQRRHPFLGALGVSGGANIDVFWRVRSRHGSKAPPMAAIAIGGLV